MRFGGQYEESMQENRCSMEAGQRIDAMWWKTERVACKNQLGGQRICKDLVEIATNGKEGKDKARQVQRTSHSERRL